MLIKAFGLNIKNQSEATALIQVEDKKFSFHFELHDGTWMMDHRQPDTSKKDGTWPAFCKARDTAIKLLNDWTNGEFL